jgi:hypothetical protein
VPEEGITNQMDEMRKPIADLADPDQHIAVDCDPDFVSYSGNDLPQEIVVQLFETYRFEYASG